MVTHCTPLLYPIPSAVWILPPKQGYKNYAVNYVQRPPPLPSPPYQAGSIFSNHYSSQTYWIKNSYLLSGSYSASSQEAAEGGIHSIYCCNYSSQGRILSEPCWSSLKAQADVLLLNRLTNFLVYYRSNPHILSSFHLKRLLIAWTVLTTHFITFFKRTMILKGEP